jgi:hypothetical protein
MKKRNQSAEEAERQIRILRLRRKQNKYSYEKKDSEYNRQLKIINRNLRRAKKRGY